MERINTLITSVSYICVVDILDGQIYSLYKPINKHINHYLFMKIAASNNAISQNNMFNKICSDMFCAVLCT